jgi:membrane associated rhomboid family serine protease
MQPDPQPTPPSAPTTCYRHPERVTGRRCTRCGRPACPECLREASVGAHCVECVRAGAPSGSQRVAQRLRGIDLAATKAIIGINVAAFVLIALRDGRWDGLGPTSGDLALYGPSVHNGEWYRMFTHSLVHFGFLHILFNMFLIWIVGQILEPGAGSIRFATIYVVSVLAGGAAALLAQPHVVSGGASGGCFGLAAAATLVMQRRGVRFWDTGLGPLILINLFLDYFIITNVSIAAHIGGIIGGLLVTEAMLQARKANQVALGYVAAAFVGGASLLLGIAVSGH